MYFITLDLEWNQAYAQQSQAVQKRLACRLRGEVIQIGAVKLDANMKICGSYSVIVKPMYFRHLHRHVSELTGITQEQMNLGMPLPKAAASFREWCGKDFAFLTWGPDDIPMLKDNFHVHGLPSEWLDKTYDLQVIFNRQTDNGSKQRSLEYAMEYFHIAQNLPAHDALNDAYFTAEVAARMDLSEGIRTYDASQGKYLEASVHGDADAGDDGYVTIGELLGDDALVRPSCPICHGKLMPSEKSLHMRGQRYLYLYRCKADGDLLVTLKLRRNFNETWRAHREIRVATAEDIAEIRQKLSETASRRKSRSRRSRRRTPVKPKAQTETAIEQTPAAVSTPTPLPAYEAVPAAVGAAQD